MFNPWNSLRDDFIVRHFYYFIGAVNYIPSGLPTPFTPLNPEGLFNWGRSDDRTGVWNKIASEPFLQGIENVWQAKNDKGIFV